MPEIPYWEDDPKAWDGLLIASVYAPGVVDDITVGRGFKVDGKEGQGVDEGTLTVNGKKFVPVSIKLRMWNRRHLKLCRFLLEAIYDLKPGQPWDMVHPVLVANGIRAVLIEDTEGPTKPDDEGFSFLTLKGRKWSPPAPRPKASATSTPKTSQPTTGTAEQHAKEDAMLAALRDDLRLALRNGAPPEELNGIRARIKALEDKIAQRPIGPPLPPKKPGAPKP